MPVRLLPLLLLCAPGAALAQGALLKLPLASTSAALGGASVAEASAFAPFQNPAAMGGLRQPEAGAAVLRFAGRTATVAAGVVPVGRRVFVGAYGGALVAPDPLVDPIPGQAAPVRFHSGVAGIAVAAGGGAFRVGAGAKVFAEDAGTDERATWLAFDAGATATLGAGDLVLGAAFGNFAAGTRTYGSCPDDPPQADACTMDLRALELPASIRFGAAWRAFTVRDADTRSALARVRLLGDYVSHSFDPAALGLGVEAEAFDVFTLRAGRTEPLDSPGRDGAGRWTFGAGVRFGRLQADVALLPRLGFGTEPGVGFGVRVGR